MAERCAGAYKPFMRRRALYAFVVLLVVGIIALPAIAGLAERRFNRVHPPSYKPSARAEALHRKLRIVDLHADSLMTARDLAHRGTVGHVDLPRLQEGNVAVQAFTIVTKVPRGMNMERNDDQSDLIKILAIASRWPTRTWSSLLERALYQAEKLEQLEVASRGKLTILRSGSDVKSFLERRKIDPTLVAGFLGIEGAHALQHELSNVDRLYDAGVRMIAPTHFFDNEWGGSAHGIDKAGLTPLGKQLIAKLEAKRMIVDLAHASPRTFADVLAIAKRKVVVSHTGVQGTCRGPRNLSDDQLRAVARNGGLVGIGYWGTAVCGEDPAAIGRAIAHAVAVAGPDHVALGSDFDGSVTTPFDASGLVYVTDALLNAGFGEDTIRKVMGENALKLLAELLP